MAAEALCRFFKDGDGTSMPTQKKLIAGLLLGLAGFAGNWFRYPLFLNVDFLFGSFFVMTALLRYGAGTGVLASLIASSCTFFLWRHPYAVIIFTLEIATVGFLSRKNKKADILLYDMLYWLCIGMPLAWIFYHFQLHDSNASAWLIMVKQAMNGIFNALLASILYLILLSREETTENLPSSRQTVFTLIVSLILIPAFLYIFYHFRSHSNQGGELLAKQTTRAADTAVSSVAPWLSSHIGTVKALANQIGDPAQRNFREIQSIVETVRETSPGIQNMGVFNKHATTVAYSPRTDVHGSSTIGISFADRPYLAVLKKEGRPQIVGVMPGKIGDKSPVVPLVAPILVGSEFKGFCAVTVETEAILDHLKAIIGSSKMDITVLDQYGHVVVSTRKDLAIMKPYPRPINGTFRNITPEVEYWIPPAEAGKNLMQRWAKSFYITAKEISPESRWKVIVENSYAPFLEELRSNATVALTWLVCLSLLSAPLSHLFSWRLTRSLERLRNSTRSLPDDILSDNPVILPESSIRELAEVIDNFSAVREALRTQHHTLQKLNKALSEKNAFLAESEGRFRILVEIAPYAVFVNRDNNVEYVNPRAVTLFGASTAAELLGGSPYNLFHPDYHTLMTARIQELLKGHTVPLVEGQIITIDGSVRDVEIAAASFVDSRGVAIYVLLHDITDRKRFEESLSRAKKEWERTFDSVPDLIAILDDQHRIMRINRTMANRLGLEPKDCIGRYCHDVIHGLAAPPGFCPHSQSLCTNETCKAEVFEESLGGDFLVSTTPLHLDDGKIIGTVHVARDISDRKRAERALQQAHDQLEEKVYERTAQLADTVTVLQEEVLEREKAQESLKVEMLERIRVMESLRDQEKLLILQSRQAAMGEMIGNIAHQWRQPLNILGLLLQQIELFYESGKFDAGFLNQSVTKGMGIIQHMSQTIDDFRNFFRPEKEQKPFSVQETLSSTIALINDSFVSHSIKIDVCNESDFEVIGYTNEFSQALLNILLNAKDVLLERKIKLPWISISVGKDGDKGTIIIKDNAGGISEDILDKIFAPYFTTKGSQQGTGLGLYMAKMIIEKNMGGVLSVKNGPEGAEFCIGVIPLA